MSLKSNFVVKCIAVILFAVFLTTTLLSSACLIFGIGSGAFTSEAEKKESKEDVLQGMLWYPAGKIRSSLRDFAEIEDLPFEYYNIYQSENVLYEILIPRSLIYIAPSFVINFLGFCIIKSYVNLFILSLLLSLTLK